MDQNEPIDGVKQNAEGYSDAEIWGDNWKAQSENFYDKSGVEHLRDEGLFLYGVSDEVGRLGSSASQYGLANTLTGKGNLGGFRDPILNKAGQRATTPRLRDNFLPDNKLGKALGKRGISHAEAVRRGMTVANPTSMQVLKANKLNAGFAGLNIGSALSAGYQELTGEDWNPLSPLAGRSYGTNDQEDDYERPILDPDGNDTFELDENGEELLDENGYPIQRFEKKSSYKGMRSKATGSKVAGVAEAVTNDLMVGGYDAFKGNHGFADMAEMFGLGGEWSREARRNARAYVAQRPNIDTDSLGAGALMEGVANRAFEAYNNFRNPKSKARLTEEATRPSEELAVTSQSLPPQAQYASGHKFFRGRG
jgi:hypothetical protein